jgi:hypothetical protein
VAGVLADHAHHTVATDDLAVAAHLLDRRTNLHFLTYSLNGRAVGQARITKIR